MSRRISSTVVGPLAATLLATAMSFAQTRAKPDNTAVNKRDVREGTLTAQDQSRGSAKDEELTRRVREQLMLDDKLSTYAKNVKIITLDGVVTLRGPVTSREESLQIGKIASRVTGGQVVNQLEVTRE